MEILKTTKGFANAHEDEKGLQVERTMKQVERTRLLTKRLLHHFMLLLKFQVLLSVTH